MTGYGRGGSESDGRRSAVEIRAVNHRFLDIKLRGYVLEPSIEEWVIGRIRGRCERGAMSVTIRLEERGALATMRVDMVAARRVHGELAELAHELGSSQPIPLELVCAQPGVLVPRDVEADVAAVRESLEGALDQALDALCTMRETEGAALARDLDQRTNRLSELVEAIEARAAMEPEEVHRRLRERLDRLRQRISVDIAEERLAQEMIFLAERTDVTEEIVRLRSHIKQLRQIMANTRGAVGRRLEFLVQEMVRELNTVAAKTQAGEIAHTVVEAKAELEKIREQVQNIE